MSEWKSIICCFPDEATAILMAARLGTVVDPGTRDFGNENFACHVFDQWDRWPSETDAGQLATGFWANVTFNMGTAAGAASYNSLAASTYVRTLVNPSNVWA